MVEELAIKVFGPNAWVSEFEDDDFVGDTESAMYGVYTDDEGLEDFQLGVIEYTATETIVRIFDTIG